MRSHRGSSRPFSATRCLLLGAAVAAGLVPGVARAQWSLEAAVERFDWREHTEPIEVRELGPRFGVGVGYAQPRTRGLLLAGRVRVYGGVVDYDGSLLANPDEPAQASIHYIGANEAIELRLRWPEVVDAIAGMELDQWRRYLSANQQEDYRFVSARVGLEHLPSGRSPFLAGAGLRILISAAQIATITDDDGVFGVALTPGRGSNPFVHLGARVWPRIAIVAYWDGMRIGRSPDVRIDRPRAVVFQPRSDMSTIGLRLVYRIGGG